MHPFYVTITQYPLINLTLDSLSFFRFCSTLNFYKINFKDPHVSEIMQHLSFFARFMALNIMPFRSLHVVVKMRGLHTFYGQIIFHHLSHIFFIPSLMDI
jgi:hypothetical protein